METEPVQQWIVNEEGFKEFLNVLETDAEFSRFTYYFKLLSESKNPTTRMLGFWEYNDWIHEHGYGHLKDSVFDWLEGRR